MVARQIPTLGETSSLAAQKGFRLVKVSDCDHVQLTDLFSGLPELNHSHDEDLYFSLTEAIAFLVSLHDRRPH